MKEALKTKALVKQFDGVRAVDHLSLSFPQGKITGLIGPNGSGKTTCINVLTGMLPIDGGAVIVHDAHVEHMKPYDVLGYGMTRTFQTIRLFEQMTVLDNLLVVLTERGVGSALFERHGEYHVKKAEELLERVDLLKKKNELAVNLSYGQRKLLEIVRAVAVNVDVYFLDEPFAGLFPEMRKIVIRVINELVQAGKTVILVEHDMTLIRELTDYVFVLESGKLLAEGTPEEVLKNKEVVDAYLGE